VRFGGEEVELKTGRAVVVPAGSGSVVVSGVGLSFVRCVAPPDAGAVL
jgi:hypothetical protein